MANYRVGDYIRLTRQHYEMSQEELAFQAGVATETISRIENGKHNITINTYRKIMAVLNRFQEKNYGICMSEELGIMDEKQMEEDAETKFRFDDARKYLDKIKEKVEPSNNIDRQYIMRAETILDSYTGAIDTATTIEQLNITLRLTVDDYEKYLECEDYAKNGYPFTEQEALILMNLANAYGDNNDYEKSDKIMKMLLRCLDSGYIAGETVDNLKLVVMYNYARKFSGMDRYEEAISLLEEILENSKKAKKGLVASGVLYDMTWNMEKLNTIHGKEIYSLEEIKRKKRQAYYIAAARCDEHAQKIISNSYRKLFGEDIRN